MLRSFGIVVLSCVLFASPAAATVLLSEFLADPPDGLAGDANGDGVRSTSGDEFLELYNLGSESVDLSGWSIHDGVSLRHVFPSETQLEGGAFLVIFGGGVPAAQDGVQTASNGSLSLNNTGDAISMYDAFDELLFTVSYGSEAGQNASLHRWPLSSDAFARHTDIGTEESTFSPGTLPGVPQSVDPGGAAVPEPATAALLAIGWLASMRRRSQ